MRTEMGRIAGMLARVPSETTPLQKELDRVGKSLGLAVVIIAVVMIVTLVVVEHVRGLSALLDVLILGVALAVAAVPEGLPAIVTVVLSLSVCSAWRAGTPSSVISVLSKRSARPR
jgi:Ca2+-transporting ATPase